MWGKNKFRKIVGTIIITIIIVSSARVVFANQDIALMLETWINDKRDSSIHEIEKAISVEQEKQTSRLKQEIHHAIQSAEQEYETFLHNEKVNRKQRLENYATNLIANYDVNIEKDPEAIKKLECIATKAEIEMDIVLGLKDESQIIDCEEIQLEEENKEGDASQESENTLEVGTESELVDEVTGSPSEK